MLCIVYVLALLGCASGLNVTCAAFDALPKLTYNNVAPQGQASAIIAFAPDTTPQLLDAFRDALVCRGAAVNPPNYNTHTLTGFVSLAFKSPLEASTHVLAVDVAGMATVLAASPAPSLPAHETSSNPPSPG
ncbi:hypothetical protein H4S02_000360 [Coemansia sp. RSA 2611]|nr:hypothetical protein H4S02_000360 [Coemansia sp. RSA 2611]